MKSSTVVKITVVVAVLAAVLGWLLGPNNVSAPKTAAAAITSSPQTVSSQIVAAATHPTPATSIATRPSAAKPFSPQVAPPIVAAVPQSESSDSKIEATTVDLQSELTNTASDIAQLLHNGDYMTFMLSYTPPQELAAISPEERDGRRTLDHNPQMQPMLDVAAAGMESLKGLTPVINATGDQAIYMVEQPNGQDPQHIGPQPVVFVKISGRWYKEPTIMTAIDGQWYYAKQPAPKQS